MFQQLQDRFSHIVRHLRGLGKITDANIAETGREIRRVLLQADVNYQVAKDFVERVTDRARGTPVLTSVSPGQQFVKILHEELTRLLGRSVEPVRYSETPPTLILVAGLQGSGKTTTVAKLASRIRSEGRNPYLVAGDVYRPAAVEQLKILVDDLGVPAWSEERGDPVDISRHGIENAVAAGHDVVILDTAGRLHVDTEMMEEIIQIAESTHPHEVLFVVDGMSGQDAVTSATAFSEALDITGTILTKLDGDARGGAALSITAVTGKPIKFVGTGEQLDALEPFHPERMASRILGMGDVVSLVEKAQKAVDETQGKKTARTHKEGVFTLEDFRDQLKQVQTMGSVQELVQMIPGAGRWAKGLDLDENRVVWAEAIISGMTPEEREDPSIIDGSRRRRIALGSGRPVQEVNTLLKEFFELRKIIKNLSKVPSRSGFRRGRPGMWR
ncbi:MAG: signal recognition particle protein [Fidelibacterota bacterium]